MEIFLNLTVSLDFLNNIEFFLNWVCSESSENYKVSKFKIYLPRLFKLLLILVGWNTETWR